MRTENSIYEESKNLRYRIITFLIIVFYMGNYIADTLPGGQLLFVFPIFLLAVLYILQYRGVLRIQAISYLGYILIFTLFCVTSRIWALDSQLAVTKINSLLIIFVSMTVISLNIYPNKNIDQLLKVIMYGCYAVTFYVLIRFGLGGIRTLLASSERISNDLLNANTIGMCAAYAIVINMYYFIYVKRRLVDLIMIPAIIILAISGSRKAMLIVLLGIIGITILKNWEKRNVVKSIVRVCIAVFAASILIIFLLQLPMFSNVLDRFENLISLLQGNETRSTSDSWIRFAYVNLGLELFKQHPFLGIGIANANIYTQMYYGHDHYLHNNYVELLACGGIIGFLIYYSVYIYILMIFIKYRKYRDKEYDICLILFLIALVMNYGAVFYYSKDTYILLMLFWMEKDILISRARSKEK